MAILKNLIVNGASRFLQKAYFDDIEVSGTTAITNLNATTFTASGISTFNGGVKFNGAVGIYKTGTANPTLNFHYTNSGATSYIWEQPSGTLNLSSNLVATSGSTTLKSLTVNNTSNFGGKVKIDGDVDIIGNLRWSTIGEHMTIQNLGGTFLVAPTILQSTNIEITVNTITNNSVTFIISDASMITGTNVDTTNNTFVSGGANWRKLSLVKVSGKIGECVLGASDGTIDNINVSTGTMQITATVANASILEKRKYTAGEISDFAVMLYKLHNGTSLFPIGIVLTSYGSDRKSYIDVYGGTDVNPVARMGNLGGLTYKDYSDPDPTEDILANQWGFYTKDNAYFQGHIKTNAGLIGGWEITSEGLSKGTLGASSNSIYLVPNGKTTANSIGGSAANLSWTITSNNTFGVTTDGAMYCSSGKIGGWSISQNFIGHGTIGTAGSAFLSPSISSSNSIGGSTGTNTWCLTTSNTFGVTTGGALYSTSGKIGGWNISSTELSSGTFANANAASVFLIPGGSTTAANIGGYGSNVSGWVITSRNTFGVNANGGMYCTSGKIGGWVIDAGSIRSGAKTSTSAGAVTLSTTNFTRTLITHGSVQNLRFAVGNRFGINQNGVLYADSVILSGEITATAGSIGNWKISDGQLSYIANPTDTIGASGSAFLIPGGSTIASSIGGSPSTTTGWTFTSGTDFGVTNTGAMYSSSGKIGGFTIDADSIYSGTKEKEKSDGLTPADHGDIRLSNTAFSRAIGDVERSDLKFAIGPGVGITSGGFTYLNGVEANNFTAKRAYRISGDPPTYYNQYDGQTFDFIRGAGYVIPGSGEGTGTYREIGIGPYFIEGDNNFWETPRPTTGIVITRNVPSGGMQRVLLCGNRIELNGSMNSTGSYNDALITVQGSIEGITNLTVDGYGTFFGDLMAMGNLSVSGAATATSFKYTDNDFNTWNCIGDMAVSPNTIYSLISNHVYLLVTWHNTSYPNKSIWLIRGGATQYMKLNGNDSSGNVCGNNITITLTTSSVQFSSSNGTPIGRLIDLG